MAVHHQKTIDIIDHELPYDTHNTYDVIFFGDSIHTTVTHDSAIATQWISDVESVHRCRLDQLIVGLDVEWRPSFKRYITNPAATLQLCVGRRCLIFQLIYSPSIPNSLINFLANPNYTFVGIGIKQDLEKLEEDYEFGFNTKTVDLRDLAAAHYERKELKTAGVKSLASLVLEKEIEKPKSVTMSRWDNEWLTPMQVRYACVDAFVCFEIGRVLNASSASASASAAAAGIIDHDLPYDTHNTYDVIFFDDFILTTVTHDSTIATQWISDVESIHRRRLNQLIVSLDVECRPSFNRYIRNPTATLQLCVGRRCLIFQLIYSPFIPNSLINFLANPNYTFVGIDIEQGLEKLEEDYEFGFNTKAVDLRDLAAAHYGRSELKSARVKSLASLVLEKEVENSKRVKKSRWDNELLTPKQVRYACVDAFVCFEIGRILNASSASISAAASS